jgi:glycosyltransferase involved in cell wall biosynthesis
MRKGIDYFVTAARIIITQRQQKPGQFSKQPVHFVWIGAGKIEPWSAHYYIDWDLRQENLQSKIHLLAPKKDLRPVFCGSDIFVLPSRQDPFPIVVHNAMAAELPIVSFRDAGGVPEMLEGGGAKLVPYGDILAFVQAIEEYIANEQGRLKDGQLNASLVAQSFRFDDYFAKLETEINTLSK